MKQDQEQLFSDWVKKCNELKDLGAFIQNDFDILLADGHTTPEEIIDQRSEFFKQYVCLLTDIEVLYKKIYDLMSEYQITRRQATMELTEALEQEN